MPNKYHGNNDQLSSEVGGTRNGAQKKGKKDAGHQGFSSGNPVLGEVKSSAAVKGSYGPEYKTKPPVN